MQHLGTNNALYVVKTHTNGNNGKMALRFDWSEDKNHRLIRQRGVSFDSVVASIEGGRVLDVARHKNQDRYPGQWMYVVEVNDYIHMVPFVVQDDGSHFLKTIIPNSRLTREYRRRRQP